MGKMHSGGKKNLVMEYFRHIDKNLYQFDFICDDDSNAIPEDEIVSLGGRVFRVSPIQYFFRHVYDLNGILRKGDYEIMHSYNNLLNIVSLLVAKKCNIKIRISESISTGSRGELKSVVKYILRPFSRIGATHFMANSIASGEFQFGRKVMSSGKVSIFKSAIDSRENLFDKKLRETTRKEFQWGNRVVYGFIGRFERQKNPLFLIDIMNAISKRQDNARFAIIGAGSLESQMLKRIDEYGIRDRISWLGRREDIKQFYNAFDAFILPSLYEGLPVVGLEAQTCGLPVFMSDTITDETKFCGLARFIDLTLTAEEWADDIIPATLDNIPVRRDYSSELKESGFDSESEAIRLQCYYSSAI